MTVVHAAVFMNGRCARTVFRAPEVRTHKSEVRHHQCEQESGYASNEHGSKANGFQTESTGRLEDGCNRDAIFAASTRHSAAGPRLNGSSGDRASRFRKVARRRISHHAAARDASDSPRSTGAPNLIASPVVADNRVPVG